MVWFCVQYKKSGTGEKPGFFPITSQLNHQNIVKIYGQGKTQETFFFILEFVDGTDMEVYVKSKGDDSIWKRRGRSCRIFFMGLGMPTGEVINQALKETEVPADEGKMRSILAKLRYPDAGVFRDRLTRALNA